MSPIITTLAVVDPAAVGDIAMADITDEGVAFLFVSAVEESKWVLMISTYHCFRQRSTSNMKVIVASGAVVGKIMATMSTSITSESTPIVRWGGEKGQRMPWVGLVLDHLLR